jgi:hypothetical protein
VISTSQICRGANGAMTTKPLPKPEFSPFLYGTTVRSAIIMYDFGLDAESGFKKGKGPYLTPNNINIRKIHKILL